MRKYFPVEKDLDGFNEFLPSDHIPVAGLPDAIRDQKSAWLNTISVRAVFSAEVEDGDLVVPVVRDEANDWYHPDTVWVPALGPDAVMHAENETDATYQPKFYGMAYKGINRVMLGPLVYHPTYKFRAGDILYATANGKMTTEQTEVFVGACLAPGYVLLHGTAQNIDLFKKAAELAERAETAASTSAEMVKQVVEVGEAQIKRIEELVDQLLVLGVSYNKYAVADISVQIAAGTQIALPEYEGVQMSYIVGSNTLLLCHNGTWMLPGEQYNEVGTAGLPSAVIQLNQELRPGDKLGVLILSQYTKVLLSANSGLGFSENGELYIAPVTAEGSTTARPLTERFADVINVKDFGAKGNGDIKYTDVTISRPQVLIVAGQSNAAGAAQNLANPTEYPLTADMKGKGFYWDGDLSKWVAMTRDDTEAGMFVWHQYGSELSRSRYGFVPFLVHALINATNQSIYVINVAKGATSLNHQYPGTGGDWTSQGDVRYAAKQIVDAAMAALPVQSYDIMGTVWLQGEDDASGINDGEYTIEKYKEELYEFIEWAKDAFGGKFGVCTIAYNKNTERDAAVDAVNLVLRNAPRDISGCYLLSTVTRNFREQGHMMSDVLHYLSAGYKILGRDIAHKLLWLTNAMSWKVTGDDDTAAIQDALDAGINGKVIFPKGTYLITRPLKVGYSYLDRGEARLVWAKGRIGGTEFNRHHDYSNYYVTVDGIGGVLKKDIDLYGGVFYGDVMLDVQHQTSKGYGARCVIEGGVIDGGMTADVGIRIHAYHTLVHGVEVRNVYQTGIALSPYKVNGELYSSQVMISDSTLVQYRDPLQSENKHTIGIYVQDLDNHIDNCNICWFGSGICMRSSGNVVSNTHITEEATKQSDTDGEMYMSDGYGNFLDAYPECTNILVHPCEKSPSGWNVFSNMYFNAGKYVVYSKRAYSGDPGRFNTDIFNSSYFLKSSRLVKGTDGHDTFLFGGENGGHLHVQGFNAYSTSVNRFRDYFPSARLNMKHFTNSIQIMNHGEMNEQSLMIANNWHNKGATHCIAHKDYSIPANTGVRIGAIMCKFTPSSEEADSGLVTGPIAMQISNRGYWTASRTLNYSPFKNKWEVEERSGGVGDNPTNIEFFINNTRKFITINGMMYVYFDLCLRSTNKIDGGVYLKIDDIADLYKIYIYAKPNNNAFDIIGDDDEDDDKENDNLSDITQILQIGG